MSIVDCEQKLINYLRRTDKFNRAIYPGSPFVQSVNQ